MVIDAKKTHPEVTLTLLLPSYRLAECPIEAPEGFNTYYPPNKERIPRRVAIVRANWYMINHMDNLIDYAWHPASNARKLVDYANRRKELNVTEICCIIKS